MKKSITTYSDENIQWSISNCKSDNKFIHNLIKNKSTDSQDIPLLYSVSESLEGYLEVLEFEKQARLDQGKWDYTE